MKESIFLLIKVGIRTTHKSIHDVIAEFQAKTMLNVSSTPNVEVLETKIIPLKTKK